MRRRALEDKNMRRVSLVPHFPLDSFTIHLNKIEDFYWFFSKIFTYKQLRNKLKKI